MIKSKSDYLYYLKCDKCALNRKNKRPRVNDLIWKFEILMRKREYYENCKGKLYKPYKMYLSYKYNRLGFKLGFEVPINIFGPGLSIAHAGLLVVNSKARIGANCRIHAGVNIGSAAGTISRVPILGNNVYIGPGAKLYGNIIIGDNVAIGANSVVNKSFDNNVTIAGIPARVINKKGSYGLVVRATDKIGS